MRILDQECVETVELKHIMEAREQMIMARETHWNRWPVTVRHLCPQWDVISILPVFIWLFSIVAPRI